VDKSLLTEASNGPTAPTSDEEYGASLGRMKTGRRKLKFHKNNMPQYYSVLNRSHIQYSGSEHRPTVNVHQHGQMLRIDANGQQYQTNR
jgi:hypothetical protein